MGYSNMHTIRRVIQRVLRLGISLREEKVALGLLGGRAKLKISASDAFGLQRHVFFSEVSNIKKGSSETLQENGEEEKTGEKARKDGSQTQESEYESKYASGTGNFEDLVVKSEAFVDKSLFIKEVLDCGNEVILLSRPRRWGKTLSMDMLKTFLQIDVDNSGVFKRPEPGTSYIPKKRVYFEGAEEFKTPGDEEFKSLPRLKICDAREKNKRTYVEKYQGRFPVIFIAFKSPKVTGDRNDLLACIRGPIQVAYKEHSYLATVLEKKLNSESTTENKNKLKGEFNQFCRIQDGEPTNDDLESSILLLSSLIHKHYDQKPYLLVDEYDAPLNSFISEDDEKYQILLETISSIFITGVKYNTKNIEKTIFTGLIRLSKQKFLSSFNNLGEFSVLDKRFADCFGFNEDEVTYLVENKLKSSPNIDKKYVLEQIKYWYDGYNIGKSTLYNPWSIVNCLQEITDLEDIDEAFQEYWIYSGSNVLAANLYEEIKGEREIDQLIKKDFAYLNVSKEIVHSDKNNLNKALNSLLLHTGYITIDSTNTKIKNINTKIKNIDTEIKNIKSNKNNKRLCKIPNQEVKSILIETLFPLWAQKKLGETVYNELKNKIEGVDLEDLEEYKNVVEDILLKDVSETETEPGLCSLLASQFRRPFSSNKHEVLPIETTKEKKIPDSVFVPKIDIDETKSVTGLIHEYKVKRKNTPSRNVLIENAFWQIYFNRYYTFLFEHDNIERVIIRAIVFYRESNRWRIEAKEHKFSIEVAKKLDSKVFSKNGKVLKESKKLIEDDGDIRTKFLQSKGYNSLDELIKANSDTKP